MHLSSFQLWLLSSLENNLKATHFAPGDPTLVAAIEPVFGENIFSQLPTCTALALYADFTEGSCSSNIVIFDNLLVFNFPFFNSETIISSSLDIPPFSMLLPLSTKHL